MFLGKSVHKYAASFRTSFAKNTSVIRLLLARWQVTSSMETQIINNLPEITQKRIIMQNQQD